MKINVIASGSKGNAALINDGCTSLLLDAGITIKAIRQGTGFRTSELAACLITHEHADHSKAAADLAKTGITVYASGGTLEALSLSGHRFKAVQSRQVFDVGTFDIMPFDVRHDAAEPVGYLIYSNSTREKLLYVVDTAYIPYKFTGLTHIITECNHGRQELISSVHNKDIDPGLAVRITKNHMSAERLAAYLPKIDLTRVKEIHLVHLSDNNSNENRARQLIQRSTGIPVFVH